MKRRLNLSPKQVLRVGCDSTSGLRRDGQGDRGQTDWFVSPQMFRLEQTNRKLTQVAWGRVGDVIEGSDLDMCSSVLERIGRQITISESFRSIVFACTCGRGGRGGASRNKYRKLRAVRADDRVDVGGCYRGVRRVSGNGKLKSPHGKCCSSFCAQDRCVFSDLLSIDFHNFVVGSSMPRQPRIEEEGRTRERERERERENKRVSAKQQRRRRTSK
jgi:hypothetical protein